MADEDNNSNESSEEKSFEEKEREITKEFDKIVSGLPLLL